MPLRLDRFVATDLPLFLERASAEGWICDQWEFDFLLQESAAGCFVIRAGKGAVGSITAIAYGAAGWIGNLIVAPGYRSQGLGRWLMQAALVFLEVSEVDSIWLTASCQGVALYESLGFQSLDRIDRWRGYGCGGTASGGEDMSLADLISIDAKGWGSARTSLLQEKTRLGQIWHSPAAFLIGQGIASGYQLGPCGGDLREIASLLPAVLQGRDTILLDVPAANEAAKALLTRNGFSRRGETVLMCRGNSAGYDPDNVFALGSMGSLG